jgi:hypothetical protein
LSQLEPDSQFDVRIENTILRGSDRCTFRITRNEGLGIDLRVERKPWTVLPLLNEVRDYLYKKWVSVSIRANSIGLWFSLLACMVQGEGEPGMSRMYIQGFFVTLFR